MPNAISLNLQRMLDSETAPIIRAYDLGHAEALSTLTEAFQAFPSCFSCGFDHLPDNTMRDIANGYAVPTMAHIRSALLSPINVPTFVPVGLSGLDPYDDTQTISRTVYACQECAASVSTAIDDATDNTGNCSACNVSVAYDSYGDGFNLFPVGFRRAGFIGNRMRSAVQSLSVGERTVTIRPVVSLGSSSIPFCRPCSALRFVCQDCRTVCRTAERADQGDQGDSCTGCYECGNTNRNREVCVSCHDGSVSDHSRHAGRRDFIATKTIEQALQTVPTRGNTVRALRTLGVEVEMTSEEMPRMRDLFDADIASPFALISDIGTDSSIETEFRSVGYELRGLPVAGAAFEAFAECIPAALNRAGFTGNLSTGVHIHTDARGFDNAAAYASAAILSASQALYFGISDSERWQHCGSYGAQFAKPVPDSEISQMVSRSISGTSYVEAINSDRYLTVNLDAFRSHRTIEVRAFSHDAIHNPAFVHVGAFLAAVSQIVADSDYSEILATIQNEQTFSASTFGTLLAFLAARNLISSETVSVLLPVYQSGLYTLDEARGNGNDDDDRAYCSSCGENVETYWDSYRDTSRCCDCGEEI